MPSETVSDALLVLDLHISESEFFLLHPLIQMLLNMFVLIFWLFSYLKWNKFDNPIQINKAIFYGSIKAKKKN